jgi:hypothetical protein
MALGPPGWTGPPGRLREIPPVGCHDTKAHASSQGRVAVMVPVAKGQPCWGVDVPGRADRPVAQRHVSESAGDRDRLEQSVGSEGGLRMVPGGDRRDGADGGVDVREHGGVRCCAGHLRRDDVVPAAPASPGRTPPPRSQVSHQRRRTHRYPMAQSSMPLRHLSWSAALADTHRHQPSQAEYDYGSEGWGPAGWMAYLHLVRWMRGLGRHRRRRPTTGPLLTSNGVRPPFQRVRLATR